jgi:hypothetical protein
MKGAVNIAQMKINVKVAMRELKNPVDGLLIHK